MTQIDKEKSTTRRTVLAGLSSIPLALSTKSQATTSQKRHATIHVSLADNNHQGIVPTTKMLGNGQDPANNLYWGALYGLKSYFARNPNWKVSKSRPGSSTVLDAIKISHIDHPECEIKAQAYDGAHQNNPLRNFYGELVSERSKSELACYVGHNPLMDIQPPNVKPTKTSKQHNAVLNKKAVVIACQSRAYFSEYIEETNTTPYVLTNGNLAPEGYILEAILTSWVNNEDADLAELRAAKAYAKYQKISLKASSRLFMS